MSTRAEADVCMQHISIVRDRIGIVVRVRVSATWHDECVRVHLQQDTSMHAVKRGEANLVRACKQTHI
jgi:hypothetical protein